jgi:hypothetical protein
MNTFDFKSIQTLEITQEDKPSIDVKDGHLIITAERGDYRIMITAPIDSMLNVPSARPLAVAEPRQVNRNSRRRRRTYRRSDRQVLPTDHGAVGENNPLSKLNEEAVCEIRALAEDPDYAKGFSSRQTMLYDLAKAYDVHWTTIWNIINYKSWKHVKKQEAPAQ